MDTKAHTIARDYTEAPLARRRRRKAQGAPKKAKDVALAGKVARRITPTMPRDSKMLVTMVCMVAIPRCFGAAKCPQPAETKADT